MIAAQRALYTFHLCDCWMDASAVPSPQLAMARYRHREYQTDTTPRWIAVFDLQWKVVESHWLEPGSHLRGAMDAAIERLKGEGWQAEHEPSFGFAFIRKDGDRRLLML